MKLYKYRSLQSFAYVADILLNQRFHGAFFNELNDPMEGLFYAKYGLDKEIIQAMEQQLSQYRVVSFSSDPRNVLLWAHYADSFKGICIGVEIDDNLVHQISYQQPPDRINDTHKTNVAQLAKQALTRKLKPWSYESEYRAIFSDQIYLEKGVRITEILLGQRVTNPMAEAIRSLVKNQYPIFETELSKSDLQGAVIRSACSTSADLPGTGGTFHPDT